MCLIIASVFGYLGYNFFIEGDILSGGINSIISIFFILLMVRNILRTKKERASHGR